MKSKKIKVAYLEDDNYYPQILEELLTGSQYQFMAGFKTKQELFDNLQKTDIDIAILDLMIDNEELIDFLDFIKSVKPDAKLMVVTTLLIGETLYKYKNLGIRNMVSKKEFNENILLCLEATARDREFFSPKIFKEIENYEYENQRLITINKELTNKEKQVLDLVRQRKFTEEIAESMHISISTVHSYNREIKEKINSLIEDKVHFFEGLKKISKIEDVHKILSSK